MLILPVLPLDPVLQAVANITVMIILNTAIDGFFIGLYFYFAGLNLKEKSGYISKHF
jgi:hypothetical protein